MWCVCSRSTIIYYSILNFYRIVHQPYIYGILFCPGRTYINGACHKDHQSYSQRVSTKNEKGRSRSTKSIQHIER